MDNFFKLVFLYIIFPSLSFATFAPAPNLPVRVIPTASDFDRLLGHPMTRTVPSSDFKTLMDMPRSSSFTRPVPSTAIATVSRGVLVPRAAIGVAAKALTLAGGLPFQAALLAAGYLIDEYSEDEKLNDPEYQDGYVKDFYKKEYVGINAQYVLTCRPDNYIQYRCKDYIADGTIDYYEETSDPNNHWGFKYGDYSEEDVPLTADEYPEVVVDPMSDSEFEEFANSPIVRPIFESTPEFDDMKDDLDSDYADATDTTDGNNPDNSTIPISRSEYDTNLDDITVPEYDDVPLVSTDSIPDPEYFISTSTSIETETRDLVTITTTTTTTTYTDPDSRDVVRVDTDVTTDTTTQPDPSLPSDPNDPNSQPQSEPTTETTTTTTTSTGDGPPTPVEIVNFPDAFVNPPPVEEQHNICEEHPNILACLDVGNDLPEPPVVPEYDVPFDVQMYVLSSDAVCPSPVTFTLLLDG